MLPQPQTTFFHKLINNTPLGLVFMVPLLLQLLGAVGIVGYLSWHRVQEIKVFSESDFLAQINANTRYTIIVYIFILLITLVMSWYTSQLITQSLLQLREKLAAIATGNLQQNLELLDKNELDILTISFNRIIHQLQELFTNVNNNNSQLEKQLEECKLELKSAKEVIGVLWQVQSFEQAELKNSKALADAANRAKSDFLANVSHELRTPLNGVLGYAQVLLRKEPLTESGRKYIEVIYKCGSHLLTLINDILDISKIEARKLVLHPSIFHLPSFLQEVVEICQIRAEEKGLIFDFQPQIELPLGVHGDEQRLRQLLINLLGNAIKFTSQGKVTFKIELLNQAPTHKVNNVRKLRFQIEDTGVGMTPEQVEKIFLPFEQVGNSKKQSEGTGLGLTISQEIATLMESTIMVQSQPEKGSTFWFDVELSEVADWSDVMRNSQQGTIIGYQGDRRKILLIDDRWENRSVLVNLLAEVGFELIEATNGQEGINLALANTPDLIITDLLMPVMDGFEFLKQLRSYPQFHKTTVLVHSASVFDIDRQNSLTAGGNDFLPKPVQVDVLLELIQKYLNLEWNYACMLKDNHIDAPENASISKQIYIDINEVTQEDFTDIPDELLEEIYQSASALDEQLTIQLIAQIQKINLPLSNLLTDLTQKLRFDKIVNPSCGLLLSKYL